MATQAFENFVEHSRAPFGCGTGGCASGKICSARGLTFSCTDELSRGSTCGKDSECGGVAFCKAASRSDTFGWDGSLSCQPPAVANEECQQSDASCTGLATCEITRHALGRFNSFLASKNWCNAGVGNDVTGWKGTKCRCKPVGGFPDDADCLSDNQCLEDSYCKTKHCLKALLDEQCDGTCKAKIKDNEVCPKGADSRCLNNICSEVHGEWKCRPLAGFAPGFRGCINHGQCEYGVCSVGSRCAALIGCGDNTCSSGVANGEDCAKNPGQADTEVQ